MKRLTWLLIVAVCTVLAQVQPVIPLREQGDACCCCGEQTGACGMPDCAPAPAAPQCSPTLPLTPAQQTEARRLTPPPKGSYQGYYFRFESRPVTMPVLRPSLAEAPAANVPLFKAHCSFLI